MQRRSFLGSILAACAAPAFVRAGVLMPIKPPIWVPPTITEAVEQATGSVLRIFTGMQPAFINSPATGTLLMEIPAAMEIGFSAKGGGISAKAQGFAQAAGMAGWFELTMPDGKVAMRGSAGPGMDMDMNSCIIPGHQIIANIDFNASR